MTLALVLTAGSVTAATFHVSPFGSNTPPYSTFSTAALHPSQANSLATGYGDTVLLHSGDYPISSSIVVAAGVTWMGDDADSVLLRWTGSSDPPINIVGAVGNNYFRGICFLNPNPQGQDALIGLLTSNDGDLTLRIEDCLFSACALSVGGLDSVQILRNRFDVWLGDGIRLLSNNAHICENQFAGTYSPGIAVYADAGNVTIEDNIFDFRSSQGRGQGIYIDRFPTSTIVRNNLFMGSHWPLIWDGVDGIVENNTFWAGREMLFWLDLADTLVFRNNIIYALAERIYPHNPCSPCFNFIHNAFWPPVDSIYDAHPGQIDLADTANIAAYPMFEDDSLFRLQAGSPLIDRGDPSVLDVDGTRSDIGWTGGPGGYAYTYRDLPPLPPDSVSAEGEGRRFVTVRWRTNAEADLAGYRVYRGEDPGFWTPQSTPLAALASDRTELPDTLPVSVSLVYYVVTAHDSSGLSSAPSLVAAYSVTDTTNYQHVASGVITVYPNPVRTHGAVVARVAGATGQQRHVEIAVHDIVGRKVATFFDGSVVAGDATLPFDLSVSSLTIDLASGVYLLLMKVDSHVVGKPYKLAVVR